MTREVDGNISRVMAYFLTSPQTVNESQDVDLEAIVGSLNAQLENWNGRGSGFVMERITRFVISITKYRPLHGSCPHSHIHRKEKVHGECEER